MVCAVRRLITNTRVDHWRDTTCMAKRAYIYAGNIYRSLPLIMPHGVSHPDFSYAYHRAIICGGIVHEAFVMCHGSKLHPPR
jgi:hypothetical protein